MPERSGVAAAALRQAGLPPLWGRMAVAAAVIAGTGNLVGLLLPYEIYGRETPALADAAMAQDVANLILVAPATVALVLRACRGHMLAWLWRSRHTAIQSTFSRSISGRCSCCGWLSSASLCSLLSAPFLPWARYSLDLADWADWAGPCGCRDGFWLVRRCCLPPCGWVKSCRTCLPAPGPPAPQHGGFRATRSTSWIWQFFCLRLLPAVSCCCVGAVWAP